MSEQDSNSESGGPIQHLHEALRHAGEALRCYAALVERRVEAWITPKLRRAMLAVLLALGLLTGGLYILAGLAELIQTYVTRGIPGGGRLVVGIVLVGASALIYRFAVRRKGGQ